MRCSALHNHERSDRDSTRSVTVFSGKEATMHETRSSVPYSPSEGQTLIDVLRWRAEEQSDRQAFSFLLDGENQEDSLTYAELDRRARALGAQLQGFTEPGDR